MSRIRDNGAQRVNMQNFKMYFLRGAYVTSVLAILQFVSGA